MINTEYGELPEEAAVGAYIKIHTVEEGETVVSVQRALFVWAGVLSNSSKGLKTFHSIFGDVKEYFWLF